MDRFCLCEIRAIQKTARLKPGQAETPRPAKSILRGDHKVVIDPPQPEPVRSWSNVGQRIVKIASALVSEGCVYFCWPVLVRFCENRAFNTAARSTAVASSYPGGRVGAVAGCGLRACAAQTDPAIRSGSSIGRFIGMVLSGCGARRHIRSNFCVSQNTQNRRRRTLRLSSTDSRAGDDCVSDGDWREHVRTSALSSFDFP